MLDDDPRKKIIVRENSLDSLPKAACVIRSHVGARTFQMSEKCQGVQGLSVLY